MGENKVVANRLVKFDTYEEFYGKKIFPMFSIINMIAIAIVCIYIPFDYYALGLSWDFFVVLGSRLTVIVLIALLILSMKHQSFANNRIEAITILGTLAFCVSVFAYIVFDNRTYYVGYSWVYYVIATILLAPLITKKIYLVMEIFQVSYVLVMMSLFSSDKEQIFIFAIFAIPFLLYGFVVVIINRKAAIEAYHISYKNHIHMTLDGLSHLLNRRAWYEESNKVYSLDKGLSFIMLDIDHFKKVNDTYGHECGDKVIKRVASIILEQTRENDIVGRLGGEEFGVVLPNTNIDEAINVAERIRKNIESAIIEYHGISLQVTASLGTIQNNKSVSDFDSLVSLGDRNLYIAKDSGRNRVVS